MVSKVKLGEIAVVLSGFAFKSELFSKSDGVPLIRIRDVTRGQSKTFYTGPFSKDFLVEDDDILIGMDGNFEAARWNGGPALLNQRVCRIKGRLEVLDDAYLFHFLAPALKEIEDATPFVTVKHLSAGDVRGIEIPLPPLPEQRRIAAILDQADALRAKRREALAQLDRLTQSIFIEMFGDPASNPMNWDVVNLESVATKITDGEHLTPRRTSAGIKLLSARNVRDGFLSFENVDYIDAAEYRRISKRCNPELDDILISCSGSIGRVALVETMEPLALVRSAALIKPDRKKIGSKFLETYLRSTHLNRLMVKSAHSSSQANLFQGPIRSLPVCLPHLELQKSFEERHRAVQKVRNSHAAAAMALDALFASLQHRAFAGQLS